MLLKKKKDMQVFLEFNVYNNNLINIKILLANKLLSHIRKSWLTDRISLNLHTFCVCARSLFGFFVSRLAQALALFVPSLDCLVLFVPCNV